MKCPNDDVELEMDDFCATEGYSYHCPECLQVFWMRLDGKKLLTNPPTNKPKATEPTK